MKKRFALGLCVTTSSAFGQFSVSDSLEAAQIAQLLEGLNVTVLNVTIDCPGAAMGHFSGSTELDFTEGVVLSTGFISALAAPASTFSGGAMGAGSDPDLVSISGGTINDACVLEFDCIPLGDTLLFNFSFGSEEYPEYVCSFNDAFGFFISGPGIAGWFSGDAANIALIPGTSVPVTISNVHNGLWNDPADPNCPAQNPDYYIDNTGGINLALDGFTVSLVAQAVVQEGETYHIKLAVGDALDSTFDTAIFFEALSFRSTGLSTRVPEENASAMRVIAGTDGITVLAPADAIGAELRVIDSSGRLVLRERISGERTVVGTNELGQGVYVANAVGIEGLQPVRFVKE